MTDFSSGVPSGTKQEDRKITRDRIKLKQMAEICGFRLVWPSSLENSRCLSNTQVFSSCEVCNLKRK